MQTLLAALTVCQCQSLHEQVPQPVGTLPAATRILQCQSCDSLPKSMLHSMRGEAEGSKSVKYREIGCTSRSHLECSLLGALLTGQTMQVQAGELERRLIGLNAGVTERPATLLRCR